METSSPAGRAVLHLERTAANDIQMRGLEVLLDDVYVANLNFGQAQDIPITPGEHRLTVTNSLYRQHEDFHVAEGGRVSYEIANVAGGLAGMMTMVLGVGPYKVTLRKIA